MSQTNVSAIKTSGFERRPFESFDKESAFVLITGLLLLVLMPQYSEVYTLITATIYISLCILAVSLGLVWGYGGIFCLGQAAFFGLGGYTYAIAALNLGDTTLGAMAAVIVPMIFAAALGYFIFWGRIGDVYVGVITLTVTLIFVRFLNGSAGDNYSIGSVPLGGFNGIPMTPQLTTLDGSGTPLSTQAIFVISLAALMLVYFICRLFLSSHTGRTMIAIRENELRAELLGYDVRLIKLLTFTLGGGIAGLAGLLFANALTVTPGMFSLTNTVQIVIWVLIGGRLSLLGPIFGCLFVQMISAQLGVSGLLNPEIVLGVILIIFVLFVPNGAVPTLYQMAERGLNRLKRGGHGK